MTSATARDAAIFALPTAGKAATGRCLVKKGIQGFWRFDRRNRFAGLRTAQ
jgi:hypothetical protein